jgi:hypothetical protein
LNFRRQEIRVQASDVIISNVRNSVAQDGVDFEVYVYQLSTNTVLNQQALLQAVEVSNDAAQDHRSGLE